MIIHVKTRNNADARRMGQGLIRVTGSNTVRHTGGKNVVIETSRPDLTKRWLDAAFEVDSYEIQN